MKRRLSQLEKSGPPEEEGTGKVREIDIEGLPGNWPGGRVTAPAKITSPEELAKVIPDKEWQPRISKSVDFTKEDLLFFTWSGSGDDWLACKKVEKDKGETVVVFAYHRGLFKNEATHRHLYAIPKNARWRVEKE